jgi:hypothetical protein
MSLPAGHLSKHVAHVKVSRELGRDVINFNLVVTNGKVERVETSFGRLEARFPSVFREDQSIYEISPHEASLVIIEARRLILENKKASKRLASSSS